MTKADIYHEELMARIQAVEAQRNRALADHAMAEGRLRAAELRLALAVGTAQPAPPAAGESKE